jgi:hypothetical protein
MFPEDRKYYLQVVFVLLYSIREYEYIIQIYSHEEPKMVSEYPSHEMLECGGCITVTLWHDMGYERIEWTGKCGFPHIITLYLNLFVGI